MTKKNMVEHMLEYADCPSEIELYIYRLAHKNRKDIIEEIYYDWLYENKKNVVYYIYLLTGVCIPELY